MLSLRNAATRAYRLGVEARRRAYDLGLRPIHQVRGVDVVSVGGITVGGSGKTPLTLLVARLLRRRVLAVAIVSRGYRGRWERRGGLVSDGSGAILASVEQAGDEAILLARAAPDIPVVVGSDRVEAVERARAAGAQAVVLDSGFQHRRLARDLDVVTLDSETSPDSELLPFGRLREPWSALDRADLIARLSPAGDDLLSCSLPAPCFTFHLRPTGVLDASSTRIKELEELRGRRVLAVAGIARPERLARTLESLGAEVAGTRWYPDHWSYSHRDRRRIDRAARDAGAELVVTTDKDLVKLGQLPGVVTVGLQVAAELGDGGELLTQCLETVA